MLVRCNTAILIYVFTCSLSADAPYLSWQEQRVIILIIYVSHQPSVVARGVREITAEDRADAAAFPFDEAAEMESLGALGPHGEEGFSTLERRQASSS